MVHTTEQWLLVLCMQGVQLTMGCGVLQAAPNASKLARPLQQLIACN